MKYLDKAASWFVVLVIMAAIVFAIDLVASYASNGAGALLIIAGAIAFMLVIFGVATFKNDK